MEKLKNHNCWRAKKGTKFLKLMFQKDNFAI